MKKIYFVALIVWAVCAVSCKESVVTVGSQLIGSEDRIIVGCDTFATQSMTDAIGMKIYSTPDSFLLGECDSRFGTLHADILAQFTCPLGFHYPDPATSSEIKSCDVDSVCLFFYYNSWYGDGNTPMSVDVYEIDKQGFKYSDSYSHNINVDDYATITPENSVVDRRRYLAAAHPTDSVYNSYSASYIPFVRMKLTDEFARRLFSHQQFNSLDEFTDTFKGLYIQSDFGSSTLLHVTDISLALYYHFTYEKTPGRDTTVHDFKGYYANSEVRQINRYVYLNKNVGPFSSDTDYVVSPASMYTRVSLPIRQMADTILKAMSYTNEKGDSLRHRPYINKANLTFEVLNTETATTSVNRDTWAKPAPTMLLIKESAADRFFRKNELPSDTCALLATLSTTTDDQLQVHGYYSYSLIDLLNSHIRAYEAQLDTATGSISIPEKLDMLLIPVSVGYSTTNGNYYSSSSTTITSVKHEQVVTATVLRSAQSSEKPLSIEVVYSGF